MQITDDELSTLISKVESVTGDGMQDKLFAFFKRDIPEAYLNSYDEHKLKEVLRKCFNTGIYFTKKEILRMIDIE